MHFMLKFAVQDRNPEKSRSVLEQVRSVSKPRFNPLVDSVEHIFHSYDGAGTAHAAGAVVCRGASREPGYAARIVSRLARLVSAQPHGTSVADASTARSKENTLLEANDHRDTRARCPAHYIMFD